jgi:hypothetical protein
MPAMLTKPAAARALGVSRVGVDRLIAEGAVETRRVGNREYILQSSIDAYLRPQWEPRHETAAESVEARLKRKWRAENRALKATG